MKTKKLSKSIIKNKNRTPLKTANTLTINKKIIANMFPYDSRYRIIVFEGITDFTKSPNSISKQINMTQGGIGLHAIKTCENKKEAKKLYQTLFQEAIIKAKRHHKNFIEYQRPDLSTSEQNLLIDFNITAIIIAQLEKENIIYGYMTANCTSSQVTLCEYATKLNKLNSQSKQENTVNK